MSSYVIDKKKLDDIILTRDAWSSILSGLAGLTKPTETINKSKKYDCPFPARHNQSGGKNKFRLYLPKGAVEYRGFAICSCGTWDGWELLMDLKGWGFYQALEEVNAFLGNPLEVGVTYANPAAKEAARKKAEAKSLALEKAAAERREALAIETARKDKFLTGLIVNTWKAGVPVTHKAARPLWKYLANRGINPRVLAQAGADLRFHPSLDYFSEDGLLIGKAPALMAIFRDIQGRPATFHRIYFTPEGIKYAPDDTGAKKMMARPSTIDLSGGAIRLGSIHPKVRVLGIAEGVETALAVFNATGMTTWGAYSASLLEQFQPAPGEIDLLVVWADNDISGTGYKAAKALQQRMWASGIACQIMTPSMPVPAGEKSLDWNDVLRYHGPSAFPSVRMFEARRKLAA